jgi:hypothetical protein
MPCDLPAPAWCQWGFHWLPSRDYPQARQLARCQGYCPLGDPDPYRKEMIERTFQLRVRSELARRKGSAYERRIKDAADRLEGGG